MKTIYCLLLLVFCFSAFENSHGQKWYESGKTLPIPYLNNAEEKYGTSVSIDGDYAVAGAPDYNSGQGCAYILHNNGAVWHTLAKLTASDSAGYDHFGRSVCISDTIIVVGAVKDDDLYKNTAGAAYVFERPLTGWTDTTETAVLTASDGIDGNYFGISVSIDGETIVVGASRDDDSGYNSGSAYIYKKPTAGWGDATETAKLTASDGVADDHFGLSVSIFGDCVVIGGYFFNRSGCAYVFEKPPAGWSDATETGKLTASDAADSDYFGAFVSISGETIAIGAHGDDDSGSSSGSVYVFEKPVAGWTDATETAKLTASDGGISEYLGRSVSISGDLLLAGANGDDGGYRRGSAYIFEKPVTGWITATETAKLLAPDGEDGDNFGWAAGISGDNIIIGAYGDDVNGSNSGSAYIFEKPAVGWTGVPDIDKETPIPYLSNAAENYGISVSMDGSYAVVGAKGYNGGRGCAYVLHNTGTGWETLARLTASDEAGDADFGCSVSICGDYIVVGADYSECTGSKIGSAYVFKKPATGWTDATETAKLTASDGAGNDYFGASVSISGEYIVVGAWADDNNGNNSGSAYIYKMPVAGWTDATETAKLTASDGAAWDYFGNTVSISGDDVVIGAVGNDDNGDNSGSAYVFEKPPTGWTGATETIKLTASDAASEDYFGRSVYISGDLVVVGESRYYGGSVYIFEKPATGWADVEETAKLSSSEGAECVYFGISVSTSGDYVVAGAYGPDAEFWERGEIYIFEKPASGWTDATETSKRLASDGANSDFFGISVSISGDYLIAGSEEDDDHGYNSGSAYIFQSFPNSPPIDISLDDTNVDENTPFSQAIGIFSTTDTDPDDTHTYSLITGDGSNDIDNSRFTIDGNALRTAAMPDYETRDSLFIYVQTDDGDGGTFAKAFIITVNNLNDNSPLLDDNTYSIDENSPNGTLAGMVAGTDPDGELNDLYYSLQSGNTSNAFAINSSSGEITVNNPLALDYETTGSFVLSIQVSDGAHTGDASITIDLINLNDTPPLLEENSLSVNENSTNGTTAGILSGSDPDGDLNDLTFSILSGNTGDSFTINSSTGEITVNDSTLLDFETTGSFVLSCQVSDGTHTDNADIVIYLTNVNDNAPVIDERILSINENPMNGTYVGPQSGTDPDGDLNDLSYSIISGNGNDAFTITSSTGQIWVNDSTQLDYETTDTFTIIVQVSDGTYNDAGTTKIALMNLNDNPPVLEDALFDIDENAPNSTLIGTLHGTDADGDLNDLFYSITAGNAYDAFSLNGLTGELSVNDSAQLDYETTPEFTMTVEVSDGRYTDDATITVMLNDVEETGIYDLAKEGIRVYPNPSKGFLTIDLTDQVHDELNMELVDINGRVFYASTLDTPDIYFEVDLSGIPAGIYLIKIFRNNYLITRQLVIE